MFLLESKKYDYGCIMLSFKFPQVKDIHSLIKSKDLYKEKGNDNYGIEKECHCTLLYGLHKNVKVKDVKEIIDRYKFPKNIKIHNVSFFDNEKYDVLKFDIENDLLKEVNKELRKKLDYTNEYKTYKPHLTIAYLKKGKAKEYIKLLKEKKLISFIIDPEKVIYSYSGNNDNKRNKDIIEINETYKIVNSMIKLLESYSNKKVILKENKEDLDINFFLKPNPNQLERYKQESERLKKELEKNLTKIKLNLEEINETYKNKEWESREEELFLESFYKSEIKLNLKKYPNRIFIIKDDKEIAYQDLKYKDFWIDYESIWRVFENKFHWDHYETQSFMKIMLNKYFKLKGYIPIPIFRI